MVGPGEGVDGVANALSEFGVTWASLFGVEAMPL